VGGPPAPLEQWTRDGALFEALRRSIHAVAPPRFIRVKEEAMKNATRALCLVAAIAVAMPAWAQTSGTDKPADRPEATSSAPTVTVTGCLKETSANMFTLIATAPDASGSMGSKESTAATSTTSSTGKMYRLVGSGGEDLKKHVGHKVQVTGKVREKTTAGSSASTDKPIEKSDAKTAPELSVTSFKHLAETCSAS
jgi:hypothetical protein